MKNQTKNYRNFRTFMDSKIRHFARFPTTNYSGQELHNLLNEILKVHNSFYPTLKAEVHIAGWRGKSGVEVINYPDYFEVIEYRKSAPGEIAKKVTNKITKEDFNNFLIVLNKLIINKRYLTKEVAKMWAIENKIYTNYHGRRIFDAEGFDYSRISGCRSTFMMLYYPLKICEHYGLIEYGKRGWITRLNKSLEIPTQFVT